MFPASEIAALKQFIALVREKPELLHTPQLEFFREFIQSFGGVIPPAASKTTSNTEGAAENGEKTAPSDVPDDDDDDIVESDVELDNTGVLDTPDDVLSYKSVDPDIEVNEEDAEKANELKVTGISLLSDGEYEKAVDAFSKAIKLNPVMALLYAKRGQCQLQLMKPNACIVDCTIALGLNPDNAAAYKYRGRAHRLLGNWVEAAKDLRSASNIDFDEQISEWLKEVNPNAKKLEEHKRKYDRLRAERDMKRKQKRAQKVREEHAKASASAPKGFPNFANMPTNNEKGDFNIPPELMDLFSDPEVQSCFDDPEISSAFAEIASNPANMMKYANNPKILALIGKLNGKFKNKGAFPGFGGGFPFGGGAAPGGAGAGAGAGGRGFASNDDLGLD